MATSGTYNFNPSVGTMVLEAFSRVQVKRTEITQQHMEDAYMAANLLQVAWANDGVLLWTVDLQTVPLTAGTGTYAVPANTVMMLDLYISANGVFNRLLFPFSRTDFASLAVPNQQGFPTSFWFDRLVAPTFTLWPVPDANNTYTVNYYRYRQIQDANIAQGGNAELQFLWLDAYAAGLAHRLSRAYAPQLEDRREKDYDKAYGLAAKQGVENVAMFISPGLQGYYRH